MGTYLAWLERCALRPPAAPRADPCARRLVEALGGRLVVGVMLRSLGEAPSRAGLPPAALVVNCSALGAAGLCGDPAMQPVRGCAVLVRCPGLEGVYSDESWGGPALTYVVPKGGGLVACLGCAEPGATSQEVAPEEAAAVLERCAALLPQLRGAPVLSSWAGLRPLRTAGVRLAREGRVVHNYGHGGSGVVVSWGCAAEVVRLAGAAPGLQPRALGRAAEGLPPAGLWARL